MARDVLRSPADFFVEPFATGDESVLAAYEKISPDLGVSERGIRTLRLLSRLQLVKSHWSRADISEQFGVQTQLPYDAVGLLPLAEWHAMQNHSESESMLDETGRQIRPAGVKGLRSTPNTYVTPTAGRQEFFAGPNWEDVLGFRLPNQLPSDDPKHPNNFVLSAKGNRSAFGSLNETNLRSSQRIVGLTGDDGEMEFTHSLTYGAYDVVDLHGNCQRQSFIPGRHPIVIEPLLRLRAITRDGGSTVLQPYSPDFMNSPAMQQEYPLLHGANKPCTIFFANWSALTYKDLMGIAVLTQPAFLSDVAPTLTVKEGREQLIRGMATIHGDLYNHPYYHDAFRRIDPAAIPESEFLVAWLTTFIVAESNKNWIEAQILAKKGIILDNRHVQNFQFGGHKDFDGSFTVGQSREFQRQGSELLDIFSDRVRDGHYNLSQQRLIEMLASISCFVTDEERALISGYLEQVFDYDGKYEDMRRTIVETANAALRGNMGAGESYYYSRSLTRQIP